MPANAPYDPCICNFKGPGVAGKVPPPRWDAISLGPNTDRRLRVVRLPLRDDHQKGQTSHARTSGRNPNRPNWHGHPAPAHMPGCQLPRLGKGSRLCKGDQESVHRLRRCNRLPLANTAGCEHPDAAAGGRAGANSTADHLMCRQNVGMGVVGLIRSPPRGVQTPARGARGLSPAHEASQAMKSGQWSINE